MYFWLVWGMVGLGCGILLAGMSQPITLLVISASTGGTIMFLYSFLLIALNRKMLPRGHPHQPVPDRDAGLVDAAVRIARGVDGLHAGATIVSLTVLGSGSCSKFRVRGGARTPERVFNKMMAF